MGYPTSGIDIHQDTPRALAILIGIMPSYGVEEECELQYRARGRGRYKTDKWTKDDFMSFISSLNITGKPYDQIKSTMDKNGLEGYDIKGKALDIKEVFGINILLAKKIHSELVRFNRFNVVQKTSHTSPIKHIQEEASFNINLRGRGGKLVQIRKLFTKKSTIAEVALAYKDQECYDTNYTVEEIRFVSKNKELDHNKTLGDYGITDSKNLLFQIFRLTGGGGGLDSSKTGPDVEVSTETKTGKNNCHFFRVAPGMNYCGKCKTASCVAKDEPVIFERGFDGSGFAPIDEAFEEIAKCPGCKKPFEIESYYLYKCDCLIIWKKKGSGKTEKVHKPRGEKVTILGKNGNGDLVEAEYQYLKIWVYPQNKLPKK
eukprot:422751_1